MLEEHEELSLPLHVYIKVDPASCSVSEIKEKETHQLDIDLEISHDVANNVKANDKATVEIQ
jgi:hypothetical protein